MKRKLSYPQLLRITQVALILNAGIWFCLGVWYFFRFKEPFTDQPLGVLIVAFLMLGNACVFLFISWAITKKSRWIFSFAIFYSFINIILAFTEQVGFYDFLALLIDVILLILLVLVRRKQPNHEK